MKIINIYNDNSSLGFGDCINKLSYLYRRYQNEDVQFDFYDKTKNYNTFLFVQFQILSHPKNIKKINKCEPFIRKSKGFFRLRQHDYWPCRIMWRKNHVRRVAINFYKSFNPDFYISDKDFMINQSKNFYYENDFIDVLRKKDIEIIPLYDLSDIRGNTNIITDPFVCTDTNLKILKSCDLFLASEGAWTHISRCMRIPTIIYYNPQDQMCDKVLSNFKKISNKKIQKFVKSFDELKISCISYFSGKNIYE